jgi:hypothetical protein
MKNHPHSAEKETSSGNIKKIEMGWVVNQKESPITHDVTTTEARAERTMGLTDFSMLPDARRDKIAVTAR